jgi:dTMP kinase
VYINVVEVYKKNMFNKNIFITIEGCDFSGKTTQSRLLEKHLKKGGFNVLLTREPGGTILSEKIRKIILNSNLDIIPLSELFLFEAARAQHVKKLIYPALKTGKIVVCDRFIDTTIAYQCYGSNLDLNLVNKLNFIASFGLEPIVTIYLDSSAGNLKNTTTIKNKKKNNYNCDRIERRSLRFYENVRKGYFEQAKKYPERIKIVKVQKTTKKTHLLIKNIVDRVLMCLKKY